MFACVEGWSHRTCVPNGNSYVMAYSRTKREPSKASLTPRSTRFWKKTLH